MSLLQGLNVTTDINAETDYAGTGGIWESGIYNTQVKMAYLHVAKSGALGVVLVLENAAGKQMKTTQYVKSRDEKGNKNYYQRKGEKHYLPGFNIINNLCLLTVGKNLSEMIPETKVVPIYDITAKKEVPQEVEVLAELLGQDCITGVIKKISNKQTKNASGAYVKINEQREEHEVDKIFRASDRLSTVEILAGATTAAYIDVWKKANDGNTRDSYEEVAGGEHTTASAGASATASAPVQNIFAAPST